MQQKLHPRAGTSLLEVLIAVVLATVLGATATGAFVTQSRFHDSQEKLDFARGVSRRALTMLMSDLRMLEQEGGVIAATPKQITVRAPYAFGVVCRDKPRLTISRLPVDREVLDNAGYSGFAYRDRVTGRYQYVASSDLPEAGGATDCAAAGIAIYNGGGGNFDGKAVQIDQVLASPPAIGTTAFLYQRITYEFAASASVPGRVGLWRRIEDKDVPAEEIVAPFDTTAGFRFYVNDSVTPQATVPASLSTITGIEVRLDAVGERAGIGRTTTTFPLTTSVFFKNRRTS